MTAARAARRAHAGAVVVGVWLVLAALFAMHGLPMQQPAAMAGMGVTTAADSLPGMHVGPGSDSGVAVSATTTGCGAADHCVATTHDGPRLAAPALVGVGAPEAATGRVAGVAPSRHGGASPPTPPDLDDLGISRT